ncbi:hypothetical protein KIN20_020339 [Parelaphostrongylus tenuis]|uniref:Uncharacterized protein n=1 Tax=Parelaphostrongylus tenuis TaxID=148309 RepID=A0AAD5QTL7_PARTN|nr:hypothetical protein KIN20_020339 [Parelaphostrongylus tenuis]
MNEYGEQDDDDDTYINYVDRQGLGIPLCLGFWNDTSRCLPSIRPPMSLSSTRESMHNVRKIASGARLIQFLPT